MVATMKYRLIVITHGDAHTDVLDATVESFWENIGAAVPPTETVLIWDGATDVRTADHWDIKVVPVEQEGFCKTAKRAWEEARRPGVDYVFWLEHDFEFLRPVDLNEIADALREDEDLAQMSLLREPMPHEGDTLRRDDWVERRHWMAQMTYWTTNPALIPHETFLLYEFPDGPECEGKLTIKLRDDGWRFGVWGDGEPWVRHTGIRDGFGY